jgi:hypothetical protein
MELKVVSKPPIILSESIVDSTDIPFIQANTVMVRQQELADKHLIPVYVKDNEPVISHQDFISCTQEIVHQLYRNERILLPSIRVSHPIKGRTPDAKENQLKICRSMRKPSIMKEWHL